MSKGKYKELSKNTLLFSISSFGTKVISFLLVPLYTYVLSTEEYGIVDILNTTISLLLPLLTLNIQDAVLRFTLDKEYEPEEVISAGVRVISISSFFLMLVVMLIKSIGLLNIGWNYVGFLILSFPLTAFLNSFSMYLRARDRVSTIVISGLTSTILTCGLNLLFLLVLKIGVTGYLYAHVLASLVSAIYCFFAGRIYREISSQIKKTMLKEMFVYSSPLIVNSLAWWLNDASDRYILTFFCGAALNGVYAVSYKIPTILSTVQNVFYNAWSVSAIKEFDENDDDGFVGNTYSLYSCVSMIGCSILLLLNPVLAKILYHSGEFYEAWRYAPILLVGAIFNGISLFEGCLFTAVKRTKDVSKTTLIGAVVNTLLNLCLIPIIGAYGAAVATLVGYIVVWIVRTLEVRNIIRMRVNWVLQIISSVLMIVQGVIAALSNSMLIQIVFLALMIILQKNFIIKTCRFVLDKVRHRVK